MSRLPHLGGARRTQVRTVFRVLDALFLVAFVFCLFKVGGELVRHRDGSLDAGASDVVGWWVGAILLLIPTVALVRAGMRRTLDETPASGPLGSVGAGDTGEKTGPYCRSCGTRNDADARFCDSCGASLA